MDDYKNGSMRTVCLEAIRLTVDDTTENAEYKIEIVETTKPIVSMEELKALNELLLIPFKNGESVLSIDGIEQIREILDKKGLEYYIDEYGVYRIDKTDSEIYETNIIGNEVKNEIENSINTEPEDEMLTPSEQDAISPELNDNSSLNQLQQNTNNLNNNTDIDVLDLGKQKYEEARNSYDKLNFDSTVAFVNENLEYYKITNINEVKEVYTKNTFSEFCNRAQIIEKNGSYYGRGPAGGGDISYLGYELKVDEIKDNKITFSVVKKYIANEDEYGLDLEQVKDIRIENETFIIVKENNDWKIDMEF